MNHRSRVLAVLVAVIGTFGLINVSEGQQWAQKMFKVRVHEFGNVQLGEIPEFRFEFENIYNEDIHIASVHSSCGCTLANASKTTLKTFEKGEIICRFNTPAVGKGFKEATITIRFDRPSLGECQLTVRGTIVTGISVKPSSIDFGQITENSFPEKTIQISHSGGSKFRIHDVKSSFGHISVRVNETARRRGFVSYDLIASLKDSAPHGYNQGELFVVVEENPALRGPNNTPILKKVPIKFNAKVVSALRLPDHLFFGNVTPGEEVTKKVYLTADQPFRIKDVRCHSEAFHVKADDSESKKLHIVEVVYKGEDELGSHKCELSFFVEYENATTARSADAAPSGTITASAEVVSK